MLRVNHVGRGHDPVTVVGSTCSAVTVNTSCPLSVGRVRVLAEQAGVERPSRCGPAGARARRAPRALPRRHGGRATTTGDSAPATPLATEQSVRPALLDAAGHPNHVGAPPSSDDRLWHARAVGDRTNGTEVVAL